MTACDEVEAALAEYVGGDLSAGRAVEVRWHLSRCPACAALVGEYREVIRLAAALPPPAMPPEAADRILAALRAAAGRPAGGSLDETRLDLPLAPV